MKLRLDILRVQTVFVLLVVGPATTWAAPEVPRRGVLGLGLLGFFGLGTRPTSVSPVTSPPAPAILNAVSPAMTEFRKTSLANVLSALRSDWSPRELDPNHPLSDFERLIIEDWRRQDPEGRAYISVEIQRLEQLGQKIKDARGSGARPFNEVVERATRHYFVGHVSPDQFYERLRDARRDVLARVTDWPWSTFDWSKVFLDRVSLAESQLARELGPAVDIAQVYQLTNCALNPTVGLLDAVAQPHHVPSIFSESTAEALAQKFDVIFPPMARHVRRQMRVVEKDAAFVRSRAVAAADTNASYNFTLNAPLRFAFRDAHAHLGAQPDQLAPSYLQLRRRLLIMLERLQQLPPSELEKFLVCNVAAVIDDLDSELMSLPARVAAAFDQSASYTGPAGTRWHSFNTPAADEEHALHWASLLQTLAQRLSVAWPEIVTVATAATSVDEPRANLCESNLEGEELEEAPPRIEHHLAVPLDASVIKDAVPVEKQRID